MSENGKEMALSVFVAEVLGEVVKGVLMAQADGTPAALPDGVEFVLALENGDVAFTVPLSNMVFPNGVAVSYTYGTKTKN